VYLPACSLAFSRGAYLIYDYLRDDNEVEDNDDGN
jgi:hypothetical protein